MAISASVFGVKNVYSFLNFAAGSGSAQRSAGTIAQKHVTQTKFFIVTQIQCN